MNLKGGLYHEDRLFFDSNRAAVALRMVALLLACAPQKAVAPKAPLSTLTQRLLP